MAGHMAVQALERAGSGGELPALNAAPARQPVVPGIDSHQRSVMRRRNIAVAAGSGRLQQAGVEAVVLPAALGDLECADSIAERGAAR